MADLDVFDVSGLPHTQTLRKMLYPELVIREAREFFFRTPAAAGVAQALPAADRRPIKVASPMSR